MAAVHFGEPDMPGPLRPALLCRNKLAAIYKHLAEAIGLASQYEKVDPDAIKAIDRLAGIRQLYQPADKWAGRFSATSGTIDSLKSFAFLARQKGWNARELLQMRDGIAAWDHADVWENHECMESAIDEVCKAMQRWRKLHPLDWRTLNRAIEFEGQIFAGSPSLLHHPPKDPPIDAVTLLQIAAICQKSKRTMERLQAKCEDFPQPLSQGAGGKASVWSWAVIRPFLEKHLERKLPEVFPSHVSAS